MTADGWPALSPDLLRQVPTGGNEIFLQYSTMRGLGSWAIRYRSGSPWSHVDVVLPDGRLLGARSSREVGLDGRAWEAGVRVRDPAYARFTHAMRVRTANVRAPDFYEWALDQVGKPYDSRGILDFVRGRSAERDWRDPDAWFCDELVVAGLELVGHWPRQLSLPPYGIDPGGSLLALSAGRSYRVVGRV